ncbi:MAG: FAD binding domain-containing protein [SAR202 cluster bacterium]|jgi:hypothetical protein|nr:FAD binding domain-containing protein [SAR202 cluster bacterium]MDP7412827.1 FAD binding domain-containing protein [SAR202 cluster bacterium]
MLPEFEYHRPNSLAEALDLMADGRSDVNPLAGGTNLVVDMRSGRDTPGALIDLRHIDEFKGGHDISIQRLVEQIQGGCNAISDLLDGQTVEDFHPIRMYSGKRDPRRALQGKRVMFRGQPRRVMVAPCGSRLSTIVGESIRKRSPKRR